MLKTEFQRQLEALGFKCSSASVHKSHRTSRKPANIPSTNSVMHESVPPAKPLSVNKGALERRRQQAQAMEPATTGRVSAKARKRGLKTGRVPHKNPYTELQAKGIVQRLYNQPSQWNTREFKDAVVRLTGKPMIMSKAVAADTVRQWRDLSARIYSLDYSIAVMMLTGIWIPPPQKPQSVMSKQIKARTERRDINGSYTRVKVFRG